MLVEDAVKETANNTALEITKKLLKRGISVTAISEDTGLDEAVIVQLQTELESK